MSDAKSARFSETEQEALAAYANDEDVGEAKALNKAAMHGLSQMGYDVKDPTESNQLGRVLPEISKGFAYGGVVLLFIHGLTELDKALLYGSYMLTVALAILAIQAMDVRVRGLLPSRRESVEVATDGGGGTE